MKTFQKYLLTGAIVLVAVIAVLLKYRDYRDNPWSRDGRVRADVIQIASRVTAPIVELPIRDNQFVRAGDVLFRLDPRTFEVALAQAQSSQEAAQASVVKAEAGVAQAKAVLEKDRVDYERQQELQSRNASSQKAVESAQANLVVSKAKLRQAEAELAAARAALSQIGTPGDPDAPQQLANAELRQAMLNLEFTTVTAPVDGYVTNLTLRIGDQMVANQPALALVDVNSYRVDGFFKETVIADIEPGDRAVVTLMTYPDTPIEGRVESLGWGIAESDGATSTDLLPSISPTFEWIRLAQRIPVRIQLIEVPEGVRLRVGSTASVMVMATEARAVSEAPEVLQ